MKSFFVLCLFFLIVLCSSKGLKKNNILSTSNDEGDTIDLNLPEGFTLGFNEINNEQLSLVQLESESQACVRCKLTICKTRITFVENCVKIFGKKICVKLPRLEKYDCKIEINPCLPELVCKLVGIIF